MQVLPQIIQLLSTPLGQRDPFLRIIYYSLYKYNNPRFKLKEVEGNSVNNNRLNEKKNKKRVQNLSLTSLGIGSFHGSALVLVLLLVGWGV